MRVRALATPEIGVTIPDHPRLAVCATHPIQYFAPLWQRLAERGVDLHVFYASDHSVRGAHDSGFGVDVSWDIPLLDGYPHSFVAPSGCATEANGYHAPELGRRMREAGPFSAVLIQAYAPAFHRNAMRAARRAGWPILFRADATDVAVTRAWWRRVVRDLWLRRLYRRIDLFLPVGINSRNHYRRLGVPDARMIDSPLAVDERAFARASTGLREQRTELRNSLGLPADAFVALFVGKLQPKKDPLVLARAVNELDDPRLWLGVAGDGELREDFLATLSDGPAARCRMWGFVNQSRLPRHYVAADVLVLPSVFGETWGLVVNEAALCGLPSIVSDRVGCRQDLVAEGQTGWQFPAGDHLALAGRLRQVLEMPAEDRRGVGAAALHRVSGAYSINCAADGVCAALRRAHAARMGP